MSRFKPLAYLIKTFVWIIRGTPLMLQLLVIFLGPGLLGLPNPWPAGSDGRFAAATVAFVINYACYFFRESTGAASTLDRVFNMRPVKCWALPRPRSSSK